VCRGPLAHPVRFGFHAAVLHHGDTRAKRVAHATGSLLHDVRQLVSQKLLTLRSARVVLPRSEIQIRTVRKGQRTDRRRLGADMDSDI
jgi:hypothetical protein